MHISWIPAKWELLVYGFPRLSSFNGWRKREIVGFMGPKRLTICKSTVFRVYSRDGAAACSCCLSSWRICSYQPLPTELLIDKRRKKRPESIFFGALGAALFPPGVDDPVAFASDQKLFFFFDWHVQELEFFFFTQVRDFRFLSRFPVVFFFCLAVGCRCCYRCTFSAATVKVVRQMFCSLRVAERLH